MKYLNNLDLGLNQLLNVVLQKLPAHPSSPVAGQTYYNTTTNIEYYWNGSTWVAKDARAITGIPLSALAVDPLDRANHTGSQLSSTISDLATVVSGYANSYPLSKFAPPTGPINLAGYAITSLASPTNASDAATKGYVDSAVNGTDWKSSVRVATTADITLSGSQAIDGVTVVAGDRVLVKDQTDASQNGIYDVQIGAWTRSVDASGLALTSQTAVFSEEGTVFGSSQFRVTTTGVITVGVTPIVWAQIGAAVSYQAGSGLALTGNTFSVQAQPGVVVSGAGVGIDTTVVARKFAASVGDNSATSFVLTHGLDTQDVTVSIRNSTTNEGVMVDWTASSAASVTITFALAPTTDQYRVVIHG